MAVLTKVSKAGVWLLLGVLGVAGAQSAACSPRFSSCYRTKTCPKVPHDDAGAAGEEAGGGAAGAESGGTGGGIGERPAGAGGEAGSDSIELCPSGSHNCAGECVSNDSIDHCGARCEPCAAPGNGTATCDAGTCGIDCGDLKKCGTICTAGCCTDNDCAAKEGKAGKCDSSTNTCRYDCAVGSKPCGPGACIPEANCCSAADCGGTCTTCSGEGSCVAVKGAADPDSCAGTCDASGACKSKLGQTCLTTAGGCVSGTTCAPDGYCCNSSCAEACQACDIAGSEGTCTPVASGKPHGNRPTCGSDASCAGSCTGRADGKCSFPTSSCGGAASCSGSDFVAQAKCSSGACVTPTAQACGGNFACVGSACKASCSADLDCVAGSYCQENKCHLAATQIETGAAFSCARLSDGSVMCWGDNRFGQLGTAVNSGDATMSTSPVKVNGLATVKAISAGWNHACVLSTSGTVWCWGASGSGQLGNGILPPDTGGVHTSTPVAVTGLPSGITAIDSGYNVTCALVGASGALYCWGNNIFGQLGTDAPSTELNVSAVPVKIAGLGVATAVSVGTTVCATVGGSLLCWGANGEGQAGQPIPNNTSVVLPSYVTGLANSGTVQNASTGDHTSCAVLAGGNAYCWGWNIYGQLGDANTPIGDYSSAAVRVQGLDSGATQVSTGYLHSCAVLTTGKVWCWGVQRNGALGNGVSASDGYSQAPVAVSNLSGVKRISVTALHGCALLNNGSVQCWGQGSSGENGNGAAADASVPVMVTGW